MLVSDNIAIKMELTNQYKFINSLEKRLKDHVSLHSPLHDSNEVPEAAIHGQTTGAWGEDECCQRHGTLHQVEL